MARLICKDGTEIRISDETETELRNAFRPKPSYKDSHLECNIVDGGVAFPIGITTDGDSGRITRDVKDTEAFIVALQTAVEYCKQHNLGA